jgi:hypothetical protein
MRGATSEGNAHIGVGVSITNNLTSKCEQGNGLGQLPEDHHPRLEAVDSKEVTGAPSGQRIKPRLQANSNSRDEDDVICMFQMRHRNAGQADVVGVAPKSKVAEEKVGDTGSPMRTTMREVNAEESEPPALTI